MTDRPYLPCREILDFLYLYLSGELPDEEMVEFNRHLTVCPSCVNYIDSYKKTIALGQAAFRDPREVESEVPEELVAAIQSARKRSG